jgi:hypothetical protein
VLASGGCEFVGRGAGNLFSQVEQGMVFALAEVLCLEQFGNADDLRAASGSVGYTFESFVKILFRFCAAGHLHQGHTKFIRGHAFSPLPNNIASEKRASGFGYRASAKQVVGH